jgi:hypothetical protein
MNKHKRVNIHLIDWSYDDANDLKLFELRPCCNLLPHLHMAKIPCIKRKYLKVYRGLSCLKIKSFSLNINFKTNIFDVMF